MAASKKKKKKKTSHGTRESPGSREQLIPTHGIDSSSSAAGLLSLFKKRNIYFLRFVMRKRKNHQNINARGGCKEERERETKRKKIVDQIVFCGCLTT